MDNVVDVAKEAIDHGQVSVVFLMNHRLLFITYWLQRVNYVIFQKEFILAQIKVVFSQRSVTNQHQL